MAMYANDRNFTDYVHQHLALPRIYAPLGWAQKNVEAQHLQTIDMHEGIDYVFADQNKREIAVQERFRDNFYQNYNDCTLRYRRDSNPDASRHASEFFKIKADYLVYGITNGSKFLDKRHTLTDFLKYVVVDLKILYHQINLGLIVPSRNGKNFSKIENGKMIVPIKDNRDDSSSFVAFDIQQLHQLFGNQHIIVAQKGYLAI